MRRSNTTILSWRLFWLICTISHRTRKLCPIENVMHNYTMTWYKTFIYTNMTWSDNSLMREKWWADVTFNEIHFQNSLIWYFHRVSTKAIEDWILWKTISRDLMCITCRKLTKTRNQISENEAECQWYVFDKGKNSNSVTKFDMLHKVFQTP